MAPFSWLATRDVKDGRAKLNFSEWQRPQDTDLQEVVDARGVNFMATICAICKAQFTKVLPYYGFKMGMVGGVHQLVSTAIRLGDKH